MAELIVKTADGESIVRHLDGTVTIGRLPDNDICLDDESLSSRHAELTGQDGWYHLRDLNSSNGTTVNGQPIAEVDLKDGDVVRFAGVECTFQAMAAAESAAREGPLPESEDRHAASTQETTTFGSMLTGFGKAAFHETKRNAHLAALRAKIEKLKRVDLQKALQALGQKAYQLKLSPDKLGSHYDELTLLEKQIEEKRAGVHAGSATVRAKMQNAAVNTEMRVEAELLQQKLKPQFMALGRVVEAIGNFSELKDALDDLRSVESRITELEKEYIITSGDRLAQAELKRLSAQMPHDFKRATGAAVDSVAGGISAAAGIERLDEFRPKDMFSAVLKKRTSEEIETYFSVGAPETTPPLESIVVCWPQPWAFARAFVLAISAFAGAYYMAYHFGNPKAIPAVLMLGAFAVPCSVLVLFFEFNILRNVSLYQVIRLTLFGGVLSLLVSLFIYGWASNLGFDWMGASVAGIVEEPGKLLAMLIVVNNPRYRWILNGLLIGACIGTGFAVVETAGYAFEALIQDMQNGGALTEGTLFVRALSYPLGGHALLSAIVGAALWKVKGSEKFRWTMLKDIRFVRLFAVSAIAHMLWNSPLDLPFLGKELGIGFVLWVVIFGLVQAGLKQVRTAQEAEAAMQTVVVPSGILQEAVS